MLIGAHLSVAKGLPAAAELAIELGLDLFQFFTRNPRGGTARRLTEKELEKWERYRAEGKLAPPVAHLPYTVNLAADGGRALEFARSVLKEDLARAGLIGADYVVAHPGHHKGEVAPALQRIIELLKGVEEVYAPGPPFLLLETMAGQGKEIGGELEELRVIFEGLGWPPGLGICLDTAHLFEAGWDLRQQDALEILAENLEQMFGRERIKVLHLNDSRTSLGSRRDRHEKIGKGEIGEKGITAVVTHPFFRRLPMVLETTVSDYREYGEEAAYVRQLAIKKSPDCQQKQGI
ncbi:MAG TPA: endonuclease [Peptococcaceae bacterium]|nr:endonuclease [Peptococcaceae bacterium]